MCKTFQHVSHFYLNVPEHAKHNIYHLILSDPTRMQHCIKNTKGKKQIGHGRREPIMRLPYEHAGDMNKSLYKWKQDMKIKNLNKIRSRKLGENNTV